MESQKERRRQGLAARDRLTTAEVAEKSAAITERLFQLAPFTACRRVMFYASFRSEVSTMAALTRALAGGMAVALPLSLPATHRLEPRLVVDPASQLRPGYCGILEPDPRQTLVLAPAKIEAVLVPGSVFDRRGGRIGYGGGFYDRFLQQEAPQAVRIGLAFAAQVAEGELPLAVHDQRLDWLLTETAVYGFPGR